MRVEELITRLHGVRPVTNGWLSLCPGHEDRSPSLSVCEGEDGRVLIHCFAGCTVESVCEALHVHVSDLFSDRGAAGERKPELIRRLERQIACLRSRLTPRDRERAATVVLADEKKLNAAIARALKLAVEGELVQIVFGEEAV